MANGGRPFLNTKARLSKAIVDNAKSAVIDRFVWDTAVRGFALKITPKGRKVFIIQFRMSGRRVRVTIGEFGHTPDVNGAPYTAEAARREAERIRGIVANGGDPRARATTAEDPLLRDYAEMYLAGPCAANKPSTRKTDRSLFDRHIIPLLGKRRMRDVTVQDVVNARNAVRDGRTACDVKTRKHGRAIVRGGPGIANRML
jgi:hypothetical protein